MWAYDSSLIAPSALSGEASFSYNWKKRVFVGADCGWATGRGNSTYDVPGYADLGVYAEYVATRKMAFWLRGGNLLDMKIQRNLLFAEKGISFTLGIKLNF